jgi:hypothetical protein
MQREHGVYTKDSHVKLAKVIGGKIYYAPASGSEILVERKTYTTDDFATPSINNTITGVDTDNDTITFGTSATIPNGANITQASLSYRVVAVNSDSEVQLSTIENIATNVSLSVSACADNGSGLIRVTTTTDHGLVTDNSVTIASVVGTTEANGDWIITKIDNTNFDLVDSTFTNAYVSGGTVTNPIVITPGIVSSLQYHAVTCGLPEYEKTFKRLNVFLDDDESRVSDFDITTSTDLERGDVTTPLYETTTGWGLEPWGKYWGTPVTTDRISTLIPERHSHGAYIYLTLIHQRPSEQVAICGYSLGFDVVGKNLDT